MAGRVVADREAGVEGAVLDVAGAQDEPARVEQAVDEGDHRGRDCRSRAMRSSTCQSRRTGA